MAGKTLIVGCGYVGLPLALELRGRGGEIHAWVRSEASGESLRNFDFRRIIVGDVADAQAWSRADSDYGLVIHCASSGRGGEAAYAEVFGNGMRQVIAYEPQARKLFVSSTSVYGQANGEVVTEESPAEPATATGKLLREAEMIALEGDATVVRSSGIYGPHRAVLWKKFQRGEAVIEGDGSRWINQIHQRDLLLAVVHLADVGRSGQIYNASDDTPVTQRDYYAWCAEFTGNPLPPFGPVNTERKRGLTNKRVSNAKLRASGWAPVYPSFREGIRADVP